MNKLALIWPAFKNLSTLDSTWITHGIGHLATEVMSKTDVSVEIMDGRFKSLQDMKELLSYSDVSFVGISVISVYKDNALDILNYVKEHRPDIKTIVGGIHPTLFPEEFEELADYIIIGEGEEILPEIVKKGSTIAPGIHKTKPVDLDKLKPIDRCIFNLNETPISGTLPPPFATIIIGRGCPYQCTFCQPAERTLFGDKIRMRSVDHVVNEIKTLSIESFYIHDDCFVAFPNYVKEFCDKIKPFSLKWWCQGRADLIVNNMSVIKTMRDAGLCGMIIGHESGSNETLKRLNKGTTVEQNVESTLFLKSLGITVWSNLMLGLPDEKPSEVLETINMVLKMRPNTASTCLFTPHPGSQLFEECVMRDLMPDNPGQDYFNRGTNEPKIKGPDYKFLDWARGQINQIVFGGQ